MARSLTFSSSKYMSRSHTAGNKKKFTVAFWFKRTNLNQGYLTSFGDNGGPSVDFTLLFDAGNRLQVMAWAGGGGYGFHTNATYSDTTTWHHVIAAVDTTQATASNRVKLYVDGSLITSFNGTPSYPPQNYDTVNSGTWAIGTPEWNIGASYLSAKLDDIYFIDDAQLTPADFPFTGTYGAASFYLDFDDNTSTTTLGYDRSGLAHNWGLSNFTTADSTTDTPQVILSADNLTVAAPILGQPLIGRLMAVDLTVASPILGTPKINYLTALPDATGLVTGTPGIGSPRMLAFNNIALGPYWDASANARLGGPFMDAKGEYKAVALMDQAGLAGPFEVSQTITKGQAEAQLWRFSIEVRDGASLPVEIGLTDDAGNAAWAVFDPDSGEALYDTGTGTAHFLGAEADPLRFGFYRLIITVDTSTSTNLRAYVRIVDDAFDPEYVGSGVGSIILANPLLLPGNDRRQFRWEIAEPEIRFFWTVHVGNRGLRWFRAGQSEAGVDPHLRIVTAEDLECVLRRWQPAHTELIFDYTNLVRIGGGGDPMEGTP